MKIVLYVIIVLLLPICAESWIAMWKHKRKIHWKDFFKNIVQRYRPFHAGDYVVITTAVMLILLFLIRNDIFHWMGKMSGQPDALSASIIEEEKSLTGKIRVSYENEVFGSTINKLIVHKIFYAANWEDVDPEVPYGIVVDDISAQLQTSRFLGPSSKSNLLFYQSPEGMYNQFPGRYEARVRIKTGDEFRYGQDELFSITMYDPIRRQNIAERIVTAQEFEGTRNYQTFTLPFEKDRLGASFLIQVRSSGASSLWLDTAEIAGLDVDTNTFEIEDLFPDVPDNNASEGSARFADPSRHLPGTMLFGPYDKRIESGNYTVHFSLKTDNIKADIPIVRIETANIDSKKDTQTIEALKITGTDFENANQYQRFTLPVTKTKDGYLEYRAYFYDVAKVWIDNVTIETGEYQIPSSENELLTSETTKVPSQIRTQHTSTDTEQNSPDSSSSPTPPTTDFSQNTEESPLTPPTDTPPPQRDETQYRTTLESNGIDSSIIEIWKQYGLLSENTPSPQPSTTPPDQNQIIPPPPSLQDQQQTVASTQNQQESPEGTLFSDSNALPPPFLQQTDIPNQQIPQSSPPRTNTSPPPPTVTQDEIDQLQQQLQQLQKKKELQQQIQQLQQELSQVPTP